MPQPQPNQLTIGPHTIVLNRATHNADGSFSLIYTYDGGGGHGVNFSSIDDVFQRINDFVDEDKAIVLALMYWAARSPDFSQPNIVIGKNITIDASAANFIRVQ